MLGERFFLGLEVEQIDAYIEGNDNVDPRMWRFLVICAWVGWGQKKNSITLLWETDAVGPVKTQEAGNNLINLAWVSSLSSGWPMG